MKEIYISYEETTWILEVPTDTIRITRIDSRREADFPHSRIEFSLDELFTGEDFMEKRYNVAKGGHIDLVHMKDDALPAYNLLQLLVDLVEEGRILHWKEHK